MNEILQKIEDMLDDKFIGAFGNYSWYHEDEDGNSVEVEYAVEMLLDAEEDVSNYSVKTGVTFGAPSGDYGYLSVAIVHNGELHHHVWDFV